MSFDVDAGKYAIYLCPALAVWAVACAWLTGDSLATARRWRREAERLQAELDETRP